MQKIAYLLSIIFVVVSCASAPTRTPSFGDTILTQSEAESRFAKVSDVSYDLIFDLQSKSDSYAGKSSISFTNKLDGRDLRVDFFQGEVISIEVNGTAQNSEYNGRYLTIKDEWLTAGKNTVDIKFSRKFNTDGRGFMRFVDPEDQREYTYTHLEPFRANYVFPCFDQPDLKATYRMHVTAPKSWQVVTSVREHKKISQYDGRVMWHFPTSAKFSTYIWSLHAGDYEVFASKAGNIPLRLFVRKSLAKHVKTQDWFRPTQQGLKYFPRYFGYEYPYKKYDQLIAPAYNSGAMENVAAVTFNEGYVKRGPKTRQERRSLASVIMHEMAHMWFGNLVTMKWWNDLWLNESFATYMAALALSEATEYKEAWRGFNGTKQWAYWEDQLVTTHPIEAHIPDTAVAISNFDGITYGKGASVMKQLAYYIGPDKFQQGLKIYFKEHAEKNTTLKDFMAALSEAHGSSLAGWQQKWLQTANLNTIAVDYKCEDGKVKDFKVMQSAPAEYKTLRPHRFQIAFINPKSSRQVQKVVPVTLETKEQLISAANGLFCGGIIDPNYHDHGYFKAELDAVTINSLSKDILQIKDSFLRQRYWTALWQMVRDSKLSVYKYTDLVLGNVAQEKDDINLEMVLGSIYGRRGGGALYYMPKTTADEVAKAQTYALKAEQILWKNLVQAPAGSDRQKIWYDSFVNTARTSDGLAKLEKLLAGQQKPKGLFIDQDRRWDLIYQLSRYGYEGAQLLIAKEMISDQSDKGKKSALRAKAAHPQWEEKQRWIAEIKKDSSDYSVPELRAVMSSLFPENQDDLRSQYGSRFYRDLKQIMNEKNSFYASSFTSIAPETCQPASGARVTDFINSNNDLHPTIKKRLLVTRQEAERCHEIRTVGIRQ